MAILSEEAGLSKRYTNHSIRSSVIGMLGEKYEGRIVIGLSGHKSENTIKQYARKLSAKKKREMSGFLASNIQAKEPKIDTPKFTFKSAPTATVSKPGENETVPPPQVPNPAINEAQNPQFEIQALDDAPPDDVLLQFLSQFDPAENPPANIGPPIPVPVQAPQPLQQNQNTMNIQNVSNVQNVQQIPRMPAPAMYFGGNSTVTIN